VPSNKKMVIEIMGMMLPFHSWQEFAGKRPLVAGACGCTD